LCNKNSDLNVQARLASDIEGNATLRRPNNIQELAEAVTGSNNAVVCGGAAGVVATGCCGME
jgi:hypothetical protein